MPFVECLWFEVFIEKRPLSHLKTLKLAAMETKVSHVIKFWTSFQKNLTVGCQYKRNMVFKRGGTMCPLATGAPKKPGLDREGPLELFSSFLD